MQHELRVREAKLRGEQQERVERERQRQEKNRILQERQKKREKEREDEKSRKIQAQMEEERKAQERMEQLTEHNRGVYYSSLLQAVPRDEAAVAARGIRRASDKVSLPASVGALLMQLDAPRNGAPCFEISTPGGSVTHTGVLDFTAPEGVVALPRKVADCLWGRTAAVNGPVTVTYKRLEKGTFVRFQPLTRGFHDAVSEHLREVLERALMQCTFLTQGDIIRVDCSPVHGPPGTPDAMEQEGPEGEGEGAAATASTSAPLMFDLLVQELQPASAVSLIDTDMEAQVVPSLETEQALQKLEEQRQQVEEQRQERERLALEALRLAQDEEQRRRQQALEDAARREQRRAGLEASLPPEPPAPAPGAGPAQAKQATGVFRLPDGSRVTRRFLMDSPTSLLFHFCDAKGAGGLEPGSYRLVMQYPRRVVLPGCGGTLAQAGAVAGQQEVMVLEALGAEAEQGAPAARGTATASSEAAGAGQA